MKITAIKTFLMHVGAPQPKAWASDNAFGSQSYSKPASPAPATGCSSRSTPTRASTASASVPAGRA
jgi:hypothetical protein